MIGVSECRNPRLGRRYQEREGRTRHQNEQTAAERGHLGLDWIKRNQYSDADDNRA